MIKSIEISSSRAVLPAELESGPGPVTNESTVLVVLTYQAPSLFASELVRGMEEEGFTVQQKYTPRPSDDALGLNGTLVVSLFEGNTVTEPETVSLFLHGYAVVPVWWVRDRWLLVGPLLTGSSKPCAGCVAACARAWLAESTAELPKSSAQGALAATFVSAALRAAHTLRHATRTQDKHAGTLLYDLHSTTSIRLLVGRVPGCLACWPRRHREQPGGRTFCATALFEECARDRAHNISAAETVLSGVSSKRESAKPRAYPHSERVSLAPWLEIYRARGYTPRGRLGLHELSTLLFLTFGRWNCRARRPDRVLPTAGNLGSPEAFVLVRDVQGLAPGTYFYLEAAHALAKIASVSTLSAEAIFAELYSNSAPLPQALLVVVGSYARIRAKYGAFAYRLTHFDSGFACAQLHALGRALFLNVQAKTWWPETLLSAHLGINSAENPLTGMLELGDVGSTALLEARSSRALENAFVDATAKDHSPVSLAKHVHDLSLQEALPADMLHANDEDADALADIWDGLITRQSVRSFQPKGVPASVAERILQQVNKACSHHAPRVHLLATLRSDNAGEPRWQTFELSLEGCIEVYGPPVAPGTLESVFVHTPPARAPLFFWFCGDVQPSNARRYRQMLLDVGCLAHAVTREAELHGLSGVLVGGFWPQQAAAVLGLRYCDQSPLLVFACGIPQPEIRGV